jgi:replicative DNA helicase
VMVAAATVAAEDETIEKPHFEFDAGFQEKISALCLRDSVFMQRTDGLIEPEYFENVADAMLVSLALRYYRRYKKSPGDVKTLVHLIEKDKMDKMIRPENIPLIRSRVKELWGADISDRDLVVDEIATFARHQAVSRAILESVGSLDKRDFESIQKALQSALNVGAHMDQPIYSYGAMIASRTEERLARAAGELPPSGITTGFPAFDEHLYHKGWGKRELSVLMGGAKAGKTTALINFAINAAGCIMRYNVLYVTLEVSAKIIAERIDANISDQLMFELGTNIHVVREAVEAWHLKAGRLDIVEFPTGTMRVSDLRRLIERKKMEGIKYDLVVVDYADLMAPERFTDDSIENSKSVYVGLRALSQIEDVALLTATQTNREGSKAAVAKMEHIAEDFNKVRIADIVISINKTEEERACGECRLYFAASRNQASGFSVRIKQDIDRMKFITAVIGAE